MTFTALSGLCSVLNKSPPPTVASFTALSTSVQSGLDVFDGGNYKITGTVKVKGSPDEPVFRKVVLHDQISSRAVRSQWTIAATGAYSFTGITNGLFYVVAFDHLKNYRAVIADRVASEVMS